MHDRDPFLAGLRLCSGFRHTTDGCTRHPGAWVDFFAFDPATALYGGSLAGAAPNME
jgi:hypothetical protein